MKTNKKTICYIDGANLHKGVLSLGWKLDYQRFRTWLSHRYGSEKKKPPAGTRPRKGLLRGEYFYDSKDRKIVNTHTAYGRSFAILARSAEKSLALAPFRTCLTFLIL